MALHIPQQHQRFKITHVALEILDVVHHMRLRHKQILPAVVVLLVFCEFTDCQKVYVAFLISVTFNVASEKKKRT